MAVQADRSGSTRLDPGPDDVCGTGRGVAYVRRKSRTIGRCHRAYRGARIGQRLLSWHPPLTYDHLIR